MRTFIIVTALLVLPLTACDAPNGTGGMSGTSSAETQDVDGAQPISGPAGVVDRHDGNQLVIVPTLTPTPR